MKAFALLCCMMFAHSASAMTAYLIRCDVGNGPGGGPAFIGTYDVNGQPYRMFFAMPQYNDCPQSVELP